MNEKSKVPPMRMFAMGHPLLFGLLGALLLVGVGIVAAPTIPLGLRIAVPALVFLVNWLGWRHGGTFRRWYDEYDNSNSGAQQEEG